MVDSAWSSIKDAITQIIVTNIITFQSITDDLTWCRITNKMKWFQE